MWRRAYGRTYGRTEEIWKASCRPPLLGPAKKNLWNLTNNLGLVDLWNHTFKTFFKTFILFSSQSCRMSRTMCKLRHKLCNSQNVTTWNQKFRRRKNSQKFYSQFRPFFHKSETALSKHFFWAFCSVFTLSSRMFRNMCILRHKFCYPKNGVTIKIYLHAKMNLSPSDQEGSRSFLVLKWVYHLISQIICVATVAI